ncbi:hypothetical protein CDA63_08985 [Hymenobacter amundsenii]|uniref:Uncharacterized protein n=1 Tax=Hymenobacter amundsenii TaxID=2006685 RepID=A0A246FLA7_9BACT|nr:hypothetical protein [Hymenobacter amundsenii]OWP63500.1 hypothetical protein CDA63_08985 [Hymenobacter amundsenii]
MPPFSVKDANLRQLGFQPLASYASWDYPVEQHEPGFLPISDIRYLHSEPAADNTRLYAYAWVDGPGLLLATERHISTNQHIVAELETDDPLALRQVVEAFFRQHNQPEG